MRRLFAVWAAFALVCPAANASAPAPSLAVIVSAPPNTNGWYRTPASATLVVRGLSYVDQCMMGTSFEDANGTLASARYRRYITLRAGDCKVTASLARSGTEELFLRAWAGTWTRSRRFAIRLDETAPSIAINAPQAPVVASPVSMTGTVADSYSGPDHVVLHFSDPLGARPSFDGSATCAGCGQFHQCAGGCGYATTWSFSDAVAPGVWTVSAAATDLAGNTAITDPVTIVVI